MVLQKCQEDKVALDALADGHRDFPCRHPCSLPFLVTGGWAIWESGYCFTQRDPFTQNLQVGEASSLQPCSGPPAGEESSCTSCISPTRVSLSVLLSSPVSFPQVWLQLEGVFAQGSCSALCAGAVGSSVSGKGPAPRQTPTQANLLSIRPHLGGLRWEMGCLLRVHICSWLKPGLGKAQGHTEFRSHSHLGLSLLLRGQVKVVEDRKAGVPSSILQGWRTPTPLSRTLPAWGIGPEGSVWL